MAVLVSPRWSPVAKIYVDGTVYVDPRLEISGIASQFAIQNARFAIHNKLMHSKIAKLRITLKNIPPTFELRRRSPAKLVPGPLAWGLALLSEPPIVRAGNHWELLIKLLKLLLKQRQ